MTYHPGSRSIELSQSLFISDLMEKYAPQIAAGHTRKFDTPAEEGLKFDLSQSPSPDSAEYSKMADRRADFYSIVGSLLWLANMTCFELAYVVSQLSRVVSNPSEKHWLAAIRVLIYLKFRSPSGIPGETGGPGGIRPSLTTQPGVARVAPLSVSRSLHSV